jgi:hypothetical protein
VSLGVGHRYCKDAHHLTLCKERTAKRVTLATVTKMLTRDLSISGFVFVPTPERPTVISRERLRFNGKLSPRSDSC